MRKTGVYEVIIDGTKFVVFRDNGTYYEEDSDKYVNPNLSNTEESNKNAEENSENAKENAKDTEENIKNNEG